MSIFHLLHSASYLVIFSALLFEWEFIVIAGNQITPVVLCGGVGSRLWPLSRSIYPKQLLRLVNEQSLFQNTLNRVRTEGYSSPIVMCNQEYRFIIAEQMREINNEHGCIFLEPMGRGTAPAVTIAALWLMRQTNTDPTMLILPADHSISEQDIFSENVQQAARLAKLGLLVTFGIVPHKPETGFGYIKHGPLIVGSHGHQVEAFVEKPDRLTAEHYIKSGDYWWNSGMFMFTAGNWLQSIRQHAPEILSACDKVLDELTRDLDFYRLSDAFLSVPNDSIDFAVMEKADNIAVLPMRAAWSDVGSWDVLWDIGDKNLEGNVIRGQVVTQQVTNSYLRAEKRVLAVVGLSDIAVVETSDAVLVAHKNNCQEIKSIVSELKARQHTEVDTHQRVYRPWGFYEVLNQGEHYQVKHIVVKPRCKLSLQMHQHRSEHWVIVSGEAKVTKGEEIFKIGANESIYIPALTKHRIENDTNSALELIEVQTGSYLGEDDIVRFEDIYGREKIQ